MAWSTLLVLAITTTALATSAVIDPLTGPTLATSTADVTYDVTYGIETDTSQDVMDNMVIDDVSLDALTAQEIQLLLEDKDREFMSELDVLMLRRLVKERQFGPSDVTEVAYDVTTAEEPQGQGVRRKRVAPLVALGARAAWAAGRALFSRASRGALSRSGTRVTQQYTKPGNFRSAVRDFKSLGAQNVKRISGSNSGYTGTVGNHRVTVRSRSSDGRPSLEVRSPGRTTGSRAGGSFVRKFRYGEKKDLKRPN